jgi:hypothetical protein
MRTHAYTVALATLLLIIMVPTSCREHTRQQGTLVADSASVPFTDGWQEVHTQDGGMMTGELRDGQRHGPWTSYFADGMVRSRATYINGSMEGPTEVFHDNGMTYYTGNYLNGKAIGEWRFYDRAGSLVRTAVHDSLGNLLEQH